MSNKIAEPKKSAPKQGTNKQEATSPNPHPNTIHFMKWFIALIALIALACSIFNSTKNYQLQESLASTQRQLDLKIKAIQSQSQDQNAAVLNTAKEEQSTLREKIKALNQQVQTALEQKTYQTNDWILLKARYCIEIAQINAHWGRDTNTSLALLQEADNLLKQLNTPTIFQIRQSLAREISALQTRDPVDIAGLLSQLDAAQLSVLKLTPTLSQVPQEPNSRDQTKASSWNMHLQNSIDVLKKLVVIRHNEETIQPLVSPLFESLLKESIRINLQEAQWAILNNNPTVYQIALEQAIANIKRGFNQEIHHTEVLLQQLKELQAAQFNQETITLGAALPLLNQMINNHELGDNQANNVGPAEHSI